MENKLSHHPNVFNVWKFLIPLLMLFCLTVIIYLAMFGESAYTIQDSALGELNPIKNQASSRLQKGLGLWLPGSKYEEVEPLIEHCHGVCNPPGIEKKM